MGGGDLNLKKSWHPSTMKNQEKFWKAEQAEKAEKKKLDELKKDAERNREDLIKVGQASGVLAQSGNPKLEWMYKGPSQLLNREEYLLGRAIDKSFEQLDAEEKVEKERQVIGVTVPKNHVEHECIPFSIRQYRNTQSTEQVDLQRKIMEDPLMLIKQKELETRKKILENPVKLKELHRLLKSEKVSKLKKKKSKKEKRKKRLRREKSSSDSSDEELDKMLTTQYKKIQDAFNKDGEGGKFDISKLLSAKYGKYAKGLENTSKTKSKGRRRSSSCESSTDYDNNSDCTKEKDRLRIGVISTRNYRELSDERNNASKLKRNEYRSEKKAHIAVRRRIETKTSETQRRQRSTEENHLRDTSHEKLSEKEKEKRRQEMMQNAIWRDEQRAHTVRKYREECDKERERHEKGEFDRTFINKELKKAMSEQKSVESRIKSNINNIQRSARAMDTNFARR